MEEQELVNERGKDQSYPQIQSPTWNTEIEPKHLEIGLVWGVETPNFIYYSQCRNNLRGISNWQWNLQPYYSMVSRFIWARMPWKVIFCRKRGRNLGFEISRLRICINSLHSHEELPWNKISLSLFPYTFKLGFGKSYEEKSRRKHHMAGMQPEATDVETTVPMMFSQSGSQLLVFCSVIGRSLPI